MDHDRIAELLEPFVGRELSAEQLSSISTYIDILRQWNQKINLTAVRDPEEMVTRHFGESLFAARQLFPGKTPTAEPTPIHVLDIGSGAGFPGLPIKIWAPQIHLTLIESNQKKTTFLREITRSLALDDVEVFQLRAEDYTGAAAAVVTMRAVERFEAILPVAAKLVASGGRLALLIGAGQVARTASSLPHFQWDPVDPIPLSESRVLQIGKQAIE